MNLTSTISSIDGHIHLFSHRGHNVVPTAGISIGFADIEPKYIHRYQRDIKDMYDKYREICPYNIINKGDVMKLSPNILLMATGTCGDDIESILGDDIWGIGEIKAYDNTDIIFESCDIAQSLNMPIYIHRTIKSDSDISLWKEVLSTYDINIVMCHCGMDGDTLLKDPIIEQVCELMHIYDNLWCDLTYTANDYFHINPHKLKCLDQKRLINGSDINPYMYEIYNEDFIRKKSRSWTLPINTDKNISNLFNI